MDDDIVQIKAVELDFKNLGLKTSKTQFSFFLI